MALALHEAGRIRVTEARASDFYGPGVVDTGLLASRAVPRLLQGKTVRVLGDPDMPLTFTHIPDLACTLAVFGTDGRSWGRPWHVPSAEPITQREALSQMALLAGAPAAKVGRIPDVALRHFRTKDEARRVISAWIEEFYNPKRRHSTAAMKSPLEFEKIITIRAIAA